MKKIKVMSVFGTRPEAIKMAPLVKELERREEIESYVCLTGQHFTRDQHSLPEMELPSYASGHTVPLVLQISAKMAYWVYDEFPVDCIRRRQDGTFVVSIEYPDDPWLCGYLLSFGDAMKILSPPEIQNRIACFAHNIADLYEK